MTDKKDCMTMEQAEQKMECLREVFSIVRLVDGEMLEKRAEHSADADAMEMCQCYSFWNKAKPCENCISMKSLREKKQEAKLEFLDSDKGRWGMRRQVFPVLLLRKHWYMENRT